MQNANHSDVESQLKISELLFIKRHGIPIEKIFDAAGYTQPEWREQMSIHEMIVAINVAPCRALRHRLRTAGGHCAQCKPANLAYQERYRKEAFVYLLGSKSQKILKVGYSESPHSRADHLNVLRYGSAQDWRLLFYVKCKRAGSIEHALLSEHRRHSVFGEYWKDRRYQQCFELLRCDYRELRESLNKALDNETLSAAWESPVAVDEYCFGRR